MLLFLSTSGTGATYTTEASHEGAGQCALFRSRRSKCVMEGNKRFSYTTKFKLADVEFAESNSNREAECCYGVSEVCEGLEEAEHQAREDA